MLERAAEAQPDGLALRCGTTTWTYRQLMLSIGAHARSLVSERGLIDLPAQPIVPVIGPIVSAVPGILLAFTKGPEAAIYVTLAYIAVQQIESNVITPSIVKAELKIPPGALMIFQLLVTLAFGALGLLLAVPLLAVLIVLVREIYSYDLLGLRNLEVEMKGNQAGQLVLNETNSTQLPNKEVLVAKPRSQKRAR